jgi:hypothetical protein
MEIDAIAAARACSCALDALVLEKKGAIDWTQRHKNKQF